MRLPANVTSEISGETLVSGGFFTKLKSRLGFTPTEESWLAVTSVDNPMLEQLDRFKALLVENLTNATGRAVTKSNLAVSASVPVDGKERGLQDDYDLPSHPTQHRLAT